MSTENIAHEKRYRDWWAQYDDMFAQKGSYAFYIQWLNNEFPSEVEYQKKLKDAKGIKKILVAASKPNHLATIE